MSRWQINRDIGAEILNGIREIKGGVHGCVTTVPAVAAIREKRTLAGSFRQAAWRLGANLARLGTRPAGTVGSSADIIDGRGQESEGVAGVGLNPGDGQLLPVE